MRPEAVGQDAEQLPVLQSVQQQLAQEKTIKNDGCDGIHEQMQQYALAETFHTLLDVAASL
jgi:hypothetical protein